MEFKDFYKDYINASKNIHSLNIDATYRCPLQCPLCMRNRPGGKEKIKQSSDISLESFQKLCAYFNKMHICGQISDGIYHPKFLDMLKYHYENYSHLTLTIMTNGSGKKLEWWEKAYQYSGKNTNWHFGLDGLDQETANIYRVNTNFDSVFNAMKLGVSLKKNVIWKFIVFKHNEHQIEDAKQFALENGIEFHLIKSGRWDEEIIVSTGIEPPSSEYRHSIYSKRVQYRVPKD
jgi:MoaA/NifB/PqqE/SkfB family radical SAM enzyme